MTTIALIAHLHQHRAWVNHNLLAAAASLSDDLLRAPYPIGQGSIWKSLTHLYAAEYVWLEALLGVEDAIAPGDVAGKLPGNQEGSGGITSLDDLREKWSALDMRWTTYVSSLAPESLGHAVHRRSVALNQRLSTRRSDVLLHVCTHAHYTAAQVVNMLRQAGAEKLPETMLISMVRQGVM
jgi:uncharacterized damage-inducible protein DinB